MSAAILTHEPQSAGINAGAKQFPIRKVAVLGAGNMGSRIAAHFANAGVPVVLLDIAAPDASLSSAMRAMRAQKYENTR